MGYASSLGKKYNAGTAWSSLGTDRSAYEKSELANIFAPFRQLSVPAYSEYSTSGPRQSRNYEQGTTDNVFDAYLNARNKINVPPMLLGDIANSSFGLLKSFEGVPQGLNNAALAGKYVNRI